MNEDSKKVSSRAKELYDIHQYGEFCYSDKRDKYYPLLFDFIRKIGTSDSVFDIGCGSGHWINYYLKHNRAKDKIIALDIAPSNIVDINKRGFNALCGDSLNLPIKDNSSDFTINNGVLHHTSDPLMAFGELVRITKPGGHIFVNVYNRWNPYFYVVHRAMYPIRYIYWNISKKIIDIIYPISKIIFQPLAYLVMGQFLDDRTGKTMFMDQIVTPRAHLFSKSKLRNYARSCNCEIIQFKYSMYYLMLGAVVRVNK